MNISSVSSVSYSGATTSTSSTSSIASIKKQIKALEKQIQAEAASKDDDQTKLQKTQQYTVQLQALETQLATLQSSQS
jgi:phage host-nuclease inhibitor protein Gam